MTTVKAATLPTKPIARPADDWTKTPAGAAVPAKPAPTVAVRSSATSKPTPAAKPAATAKPAQEPVAPAPPAKTVLDASLWERDTEDDLQRIGRVTVLALRLDMTPGEVVGEMRGIVAAWDALIGEVE